MANNDQINLRRKYIGRKIFELNQIKGSVVKNQKGTMIKLN